MRGLEGEMVRIRKVARNYGNSYNTRFIEGLHPEKDSYIDHYDGVRMCTNRMRWSVRRVKIEAQSFVGCCMITEFRARMLRWMIL